MSKIRIIANDGVGGIIQGFCCAKYCSEGNDVEVALPVRDEVYKPLEFLFSDKFKLNQLPDFFSPMIEKDDQLWDKLSHGFDESYFFEPDLLFNNKHAFDYNKYGVSLDTIKTTRLLQYKYKPEGKIIYCALNTSTKDYQYSHTPALLNFLGRLLPDYTIYFNSLNSWAGKTLFNGDLKNLPSNVLIKNEEQFELSLEYLFKSSYCICLDNGISHIAYSLGVPRLLISNRFDNDFGLKWVARWYENISECINYNNSPKNIAELVKLNLEIPQTQLIPRIKCMENLDKDFKQLLYFKN